MKKHTEIIKTTSLFEKVENSENKLKSIQSLIKQIWSPQCSDLEQAASSFAQGIGQKKTVINLASETCIVGQKTSKIKKNKRKNKKKWTVPNGLPTIQERQKQQICECCSGKIICTPTHDEEESEDEYTIDSHIETIIQQISEQLLESYYDRVDKAIGHIGSTNRNGETKQSRTFLTVVKKLGQVFTEYNDGFKEQIRKAIDEQDLETLQATFSFCEQFKAYIIQRFPLFKDFIENFNIGELTKQQQNQFTLLKKNELVNSLYLHMQQILIKRQKKKTKRQQQKQKQKNNSSNISTSENKKISPTIASIVTEQENEIIERLQNLKIKQKQRSNCFFSLEILDKYDCSKHKFKEMEGKNHCPDRQQ